MADFLQKIRALHKDSKGAALVEFAFVAPFLLLVIMGILDVGHRIYTTAILQGSVQKAARDATLDDGAANETAIDDRVKELMAPVVQDEPISQYTFTRQNYSDFSDVSQPEDYTDTDGDGVCNNGEPYDDVNGNDTWDADRGSAGQGNAKDAVLYTASITFPRLFPMASLIGLPQNETITATTVLRNQPFGEATDRGEIKNCA